MISSIFLWCFLSFSIISHHFSIVFPGGKRRHGVSCRFPSWENNGVVFPVIFLLGKSQCGVSCHFPIVLFSGKTTAWCFLSFSIICFMQSCFCGVPWTPHGIHVETMWCPHHMVSMCPCGNHIVSMWKLCDIHMETKWCLCGNHMVSTWKLCCVHVVIT